MKANRKFLNNDDDAVSPVIAVILMVAITVVLAATVYVWVSGFGSNSSQPAKSIALTSNGAIYDCDGAGVGTATCKDYLVASASPGMKWSDISFTVNGAPQALSTTNGDCGTTLLTANQYAACAGTGANPEASAGLVDAGNRLRFRAASADSLVVLDSGSNSMILTLTVQ